MFVYLFLNNFLPARCFPSNKRKNITQFVIFYVILQTLLNPLFNPTHLLET